MLRVWVGVLSALLCSVSSVQAADLESAWHAPTTCPTAQEADLRLRERIGGASPLAMGAAEVWIDHAPSGELRARITLIDAEGQEQRLLYGRDCAALSDAVLLVISMAAEVEEAREPAAALEPDPELQDTSPRPDMESASVDVPRAESTGPFTSTRLGPVLAIDRGALPSKSFAGGGAVALGVRRFQGSLAVTYFSRRHVRVAERDGASAEFGLITGELRACYLALGDAFDAARVRANKHYAFGPCVGLELGSQRGQGMGLSRAATHAGLWAASLFGVGLSLGPYGRVAPTGSLSMGLAMRRPRFEVDEAGLVFQAKPVFMRATLGLMVELNP